jgi:hypothetical protein
MRTRWGQLPAAAAGAELVLAAGLALGVLDLLDPVSDVVVPDDEPPEPPSEPVLAEPPDADFFPERESVR